MPTLDLHTNANALFPSRHHSIAGPRKTFVIENVVDSEESPVTDSQSALSDGRRSFVVETVSESGLSSYDVSPDNSANFELSRHAASLPSTSLERPSQLPVSSSTAETFAVKPEDLQKVDGAIGMMLYSMIQVLKNPKMATLVNELERKYGSESTGASPTPSAVLSPDMRSTSCPPHTTEVRALICVQLFYCYLHCLFYRQTTIH